MAEQKQEINYVGQDRNHTALIKMEWRGADLWKSNWGFLTDGYAEIDRMMRQFEQKSTFELPLEFSEPTRVSVPADVYFWKRQSARTS